ncbi:MAG: helix-turn-helix domain-containing protein, partial [Verrucomicrobia bacterium]|nr:helix-turn-helix domain-containing protein [Verrucomicrobiota bacterium]
PRMTVPQVRTTTVKEVQADGSILIKPGKVVVVEDYVGTGEVARILGVSQRWVESECESGRFRTAFKPGLHSSSWWKVARSEIMARLERENG